MREAKELNEPTELYYAQPLEVKDRCDREFVQNIIYESWISLYIYLRLLTSSFATGFSKSMLQLEPLVTQNLIDITCANRHQSVIVVSCCWQSIKADITATQSI